MSVDRFGLWDLPSHLRLPWPPESTSRGVTDESWLSREVVAMATAWSRGQRVFAAEIIDRTPGIADEAAVRLIYEEVSLRRESGEDVHTTEVVGRYPRWKDELEILLGCDRMLRPLTVVAVLPEVGEHLGPFFLKAELGRGASGKTYLASEPTLADRPVVLKVISDDQEEHLSLARLQHTNIIPLFSEHCFPERRLRALCMPYLGGTSLARILEALATIPPPDRRGRDIIHVLDRVQLGGTNPILAEGPYRRSIETESYVEAVCWMGTRLADALHEAHAHGLVHMDVKPSNVLIAADGSPMLLDFHLARLPIAAGERFPGRIGGTPGWMAPEHSAALSAVASGNPVPEPVDHRADIYALGQLLREALIGYPGSEEQGSLRRRNPEVSGGLEAIIRKCLADRPADRYPDAAALADDLRRHLNDWPLRGVRNPLRERVVKLWRRQPGKLVGVAMGFLSVFLITVIAWGYVSIGEEKAEQAALRERLRISLRNERAATLHKLAEQVRFRYGIEVPAEPEADGLLRNVRTIWNDRRILLDHLTTPPDPVLEREIRSDLLELVATWAEVRTRLAPAAEARRAQEEALAIVEEARADFGPSFTIDRLRRSLADRLGQVTSPSEEEATPRSDHDHYDLGRSMLREKRFDAAAEQFRPILDRHPEDFWSRFYLGLCEFRKGRYEAAVSAFAICIALAPARAECYFNHAVAAEALGRCDDALNDYRRALEKDPILTAARLNRAILWYKSGRHHEAIAELRRALNTPTDPMTQGRIHYNLALVYLARGDRASARASADRAIKLGDEEAWDLRDRLRTDR
jgi:eukaryotic-like serine/threonine-protein kinase